MNAVICIWETFERRKVETMTSQRIAFSRYDASIVPLQRTIFFQKNSRACTKYMGNDRKECDEAEAVLRASTCRMTMKTADLVICVLHDTLQITKPLDWRNSNHAPKFPFVFRLTCGLPDGASMGD